MPFSSSVLLCSDVVHRQIALDAVAHLTLGCQGFGCEDALCHLLNHAWPNAFENNAHVIQRFVFSSDAMRVSIGPGRLLQYVIQVFIICSPLINRLMLCLHQSISAVLSWKWLICPTETRC